MTSYNAPLGYAPAGTARRHSVLAGAVVAITGVGLLVVGGCFLMGVLAIVSPQVIFPAATRVALSPGEISLICVLYLAAFVAFAGGGTLVVLAARRLLRILHEAPEVPPQL
jgi:hypothetical protein